MKCTLVGDGYGERWAGNVGRREVYVVGEGELKI
jgi:hypothetical protein